jgi:hypothetical protein
VETRDVSFLSLPNEIQKHILSFLSVKELAVTNAVLKVFDQLSNDDILWRPIAKQFNATLITGKSAKECVKIKLQERKEETNKVLQLMFAIPRNPGDQFNENCRYFQSQNRGSKALRRMIEDTLIASYGENYNSNLQRVQLLCFHRVKPNISDLRFAIEKFKLEVVKFFMDNNKKEFEQEIAKSEEHLQKAADPYQQILWRDPGQQTRWMNIIKYQKQIFEKAQTLINNKK